MTGLNSILIASLFVVGCIAFEEIGEFCSHDGEIKALPNVCSRYLECEKGRFVVRKCVQGKIFDNVKKECVALFLSPFGCHRHCTFNDKLPVKGNQNKFVFCENGKIKVESCDGYFNRFTKRCDQYKENNFEKFNGYRNQWVSEALVTGSKCEPGNRKPIKDSCSKYMECDSTKSWVPGECPDCQHFEPESMECVWAWKYYCGGSVTTNNPTSTFTGEPSSSSEPTSSTDGPTSDSTITEMPTSETSPTEGPTSEVSPTEGPTSETSPTEGPTSEVSPTEGPTSETTPTELPTTDTPTELPTTDTPTSVTPFKTTTIPTTTTTTPTTTTTTPTTTTTTPTTTTTTPTTTTNTPTTTTTTPSTTTTTPTTTTTKPTTTTTKPSTTTTTSTTPIPQCKNGTKKVFKKGDCKDYLECDSGKWVKKTCSFGYDFDINKLTCVFSWWAKC